MRNVKTHWIESGTMLSHGGFPSRHKVLGRGNSTLGLWAWKMKPQTPLDSINKDHTTIILKGFSLKPLQTWSLHFYDYDKGYPNMILFTQTS